MIETFHRMRAAQSRSPLLSLPAELRLEILRMLLNPRNGISETLCKRTISANIAAKSSTSQARRIQKTIRSKKCKEPQHDHLQPRLLRACQQLYFEGVEILYGEVQLKLLLHITASFNGARPCAAQLLREPFLLAQGGLMESLPGFAFQNFRHLRLEFRVERKTDDNEQPEKGVGDKYLYMPSRVEQIVHTLQHLGPHLRDKFVEVSFRQRRHAWQPPDEQDLERMLTLFQLVRCRRITFLDFAPSQVEHIAAKVEGTEEVVDLFAKANDAYDLVPQTSRPFLWSQPAKEEKKEGERGQEIRHWPPFLGTRSVRDAAFAFDSERFYEVTRDTLIGALETHQEMSRNTRKRLRRGFRDAGRAAKRFCHDIQKLLPDYVVLSDMDESAIDSGDSSTASDVFSSTDWSD